MMVPGTGNEGDHPQEEQQQHENHGKCKNKVRPAAQTISELRRFNGHGWYAQKPSSSYADFR